MEMQKMFTKVQTIIIEKKHKSGAFISEKDNFFEEESIKWSNFITD